MKIITDANRQRAYLELLSKLPRLPPPRLTAPVTWDKRQQALQQFHQVFFQFRELERHREC